MKKLFLFTLLLLSTFAFAGEWQIKNHEADPMQNEEAFTSYTYISDNGDAFVFWSNEDEKFAIFTPRVFNTESGRYGLYLMANVGLYDDNGNFMEKFEIYCNNYDRSFHSMFSGKIDDARASAKKVIQHLVNTSGSVRIIAPVYSGENMNIRIPSLHDFINSISVQQENADSNSSPSNL